VDGERVGPAGADALRRMMLMEQPPDLDGPPPGVAPGDGPEEARRGRGGAAAASGGGPATFAPAAAANFRANLLREGNLPDSQLARVAVPTVVVVSARDRMLPSLVEGGGQKRALYWVLAGACLGLLRLVGRAG
jgi:hypothetical protein